ncbi:Phage P22-like portal protein [uncultured Caudovirales phage]|uniref:Phage P22-like portal protein n=1 Tax=uncultured Caudovirales phage TaxID=2100421 RepID=A0A6J5M4K7_9CAUD|nr:Phage P22-like portal protein [uncultured Caudovirales phage]
MATNDGMYVSKEAEDAVEEILEDEEKYDSHQSVMQMLQAAQWADHDNREKAREAHLFVSKKDGQWEPFWWNNNVDKPRYTFDMVSPIVDQIAGEIEQADFDVKVSPAGGSASKDIAEVYDGIIRNLETISNASMTYSRAARGAVTCGFDAWRIVQKYADDNSFDQDLLIEPIGNAIDRVWFDPSAQLQDKSDARYCFVLHPIAADEYSARWPEGKAASIPDDREGDAYYDKAEVVVIGELLYIEEYMRELVLMSNGQVHEVDDDFESVRDELLAMGVQEVRRRERKYKKVCSRLFDATDFLEDDKDTVFCYLPVIPVYANFKILENKTIYYGAVEKLMDSQRVLNYSLSREIEEGALAPRAKYWMTHTQAAGHELQLQTLNTNTDPVQFYNVDPSAPPPTQQGGAQINPGLRTISEAMRGIIGMAAGMFASNMGDNPGLQSGVAIERLQNKGDNGTHKYFQAAEIAIGHTGRVLVSAIPKVYDSQRQMRLMYDDGSAEMKLINQEVIDNQSGKVVKLNDLSAGTYDVVCKAGPSFRNRQEQTLKTLLDIAQIDPTILQLGGDLLLKNVVSPVAESLAERKRAQMISQGLIPPSQMTDEERQELEMRQQNQQPQQDPNMVLAMAEVKKAEADALNAQNNQTKLQLDAAKLQLEMRKFEAESAVGTAEAQAAITKSATEQQLTQAKIKTEDAKVALEAEKLRLEQESLRLEQQRLIVEADTKAAELRLKEQIEVLKMQQAQIKTTARFNRQTGQIEPV